MMGILGGLSLESDSGPIARCTGFGVWPHVSDPRCCYCAESHAVDSARRHQPLLGFLLLAISNALLSSGPATPEREQPRKWSGATGRERDGQRRSQSLAPPCPIPLTHFKTVLPNELGARSREVAREERIPAGEDGERDEDDEHQPHAHSNWD